MSCRGKGPVPLIRFHKVQSMCWSMCKVVGSSSSTGRRRRERKREMETEAGSDRPRETSKSRLYMRKKTIANKIYNQVA